MGGIEGQPAGFLMRARRIVRRRGGVDMVEFELGSALLSGFLATVAMSMMMAVARTTGMTRMPAMPLVVGSMFTRDRRRAAGLGLVVHYVVMGAGVFGSLYALRYVALDDTTWWLGVAFGAAHGVVVGAVALPMLAKFHPRIRHQVAPVSDGGDGLWISSPGFFGVRWGAMTPMGVVVGHALFGVVSALVYGWLT
jgi:hypothetical protein